MGGLFSMDGPIYRVGSVIADIMILSLLWIVFSIPIFTVGAATTALFYVTTRRISDKEGYLFRDFWKSFKANFLQATVVWLILAFATLLLFFNIYNRGILGDMAQFLVPVYFFIYFEITLVSIYVYPLMARFEIKGFQVLKTSFFMANRHLFTSLLCLVMGVGVLFVSYMYPLFIVVAMGVYAFGISYFIMKVFKKYRPEIDASDRPPEEIEEQGKQKRWFHNRPGQ